MSFLARIVRDARRGPRYRPAAMVAAGAIGLAGLQPAAEGAPAPRRRGAPAAETAPPKSPPAMGAEPALPPRLSLPRSPARSDASDPLPLPLTIGPLRIDERESKPGAEAEESGLRWQEPAAGQGSEAPAASAAAAPYAAWPPSAAATAPHARHTYGAAAAWGDGRPTPSSNRPGAADPEAGAGAPERPAPGGHRPWPPAPGAEEAGRSESNPAPLRPREEAESPPAPPGAAPERPAALSPTPAWWADPAGLLPAPRQRAAKPPPAQVRIGHINVLIQGEDKGQAKRPPGGPRDNPSRCYLRGL
jgi:hypothetical protein